MFGGILGLFLAVWRGLAADRQSRASRSQADVSRRAHITEVFNDAVKQLGSERLEMRLGAIYTLKQINNDFPDFKHYVFQLLSSYVRERTSGVDPTYKVEADVREIIDFFEGRARRRLSA